MLFGNKNIGIYVFLSLTLFVFSTFSEAEQLQDYRLSADDVVSVTVFDEPDLSIKETRVSSAGTIAMPLIGQVNVKNLTIQEAEILIKEKYLGDYLKKPAVTVTIIEYREFYVNGQVKRPGGYSYREGLTVERAITLAGGFTERASKSEVKIFRDGTTIDEAKMEYSIKPGDVITVQESFF